MSQKKKPQPLDWAQLRFSIIGTLLARPPEPGELGRAFEFLASQHYKHPTEDQLITFSASTIERWYYKALNAIDPIAALSRKIRSDAGQTKAMTPKLLTALHQQYVMYSSWSYKLHADNLAALVEEHPELGEAPSYSTVVRRMKERGWYKKKSKQSKTKGQIRAQERLEQLEVRGFESEYVNALWHLDFHEGSRRVVDINGNWHTPVALCILDDRSRLCCHLQWYLDETADSLIHGLTQAFHKRGLPRSQMTDNGSAMIAHETKNGLLRLGVSHDLTLPYSPYQNGKQEAFWNQIEGRLLNMLSRVKPLSLDFLNHSSQAWVEMEYNRSFHEEINESPLDRFLNGPDVSRPSPDSEAIRFAFTVQESRKQRRSDGTVTIKGTRFEIPSRFRHLETIHVRYQTWNLSLAYLVDERTGHQLARIFPQDKIKNSNGMRRTKEPITNDNESTNTVEVESNPVPPLLRKLIADYAATGLPPAYIPKNIE